MEITYSYHNLNLLILLVGGAVIFHLLSVKKSKERTIKFGNYETLKRVMKKDFLARNNLPLLLRILAFFFLIVAISDFTITVITTVADIDLVIAIDNSASMFSTDNGTFQPYKLEAAKRILLELVDEIPPGTRVGVLTVSDSAHSQLTEMTEDKRELKDAILNIGLPNEAGGPEEKPFISTITVASTMLYDSNKTKVLLLVTDGQMLENVSINKSLEYLGEGIIINTIGVGLEMNKTNHTINIEIPEFLRENNATMKRIVYYDPEPLKQLAAATGGRYLPATNQTMLEQAFRDAVLKAQIKTIKLMKPALTIAIILLFIEWALGATRYKTIP